MQTFEQFWTEYAAEVVSRLALGRPKPTPKSMAMEAWHAAVRAMTEQRAAELRQAELDRTAEQRHEHNRIRGTLVRRLTRSSHDDA